MFDRNLFLSQTLNGENVSVLIFNAYSSNMLVTRVICIKRVNFGQI